MASTPREGMNGYGSSSSPTVQQRRSTNSSTASTRSSASTGNVPVQRVRSEGSLASDKALTNRNVDWIGSIWFWLAYILAIIIFRIGIFAYLPHTIVSTETEWTVTNFVHAIISFIGLHWNRGSPFWNDQGEYIEETVWEQIDNGVPWTATRKFLIIVPVVLFIISAHFSNYDLVQLLINVFILAVLLIAKLPELHGVRILGINSAHLEE